jgi:NAD(P)-dependent dehydrogenase (short-subunit alcohol dehydrogenase family)
MSDWSPIISDEESRRKSATVYQLDSTQQWSATNFPPETGKLAVVTCSANGLGLDIAAALAQAGADVILTGRNQADGHEALANIRPLVPNTLVRFEKLDLTSLSSVVDFSSRLIRAGRPIDLLVNNACTLALVNRQITPDGFELHLAANYMSHFALTAHLLPLLRAGRQPRVLQVTSTGRHHGEIHLSDLQLERGFTPLKAYSQSKLAMLIFALELQRRSDEHGWGLRTTAAQPIGARAALIANSLEVKGSAGWYRRALGFDPSESYLAAHRSLATETGHGEETTESSTAKSLMDVIGPPAPEALDMRVYDPMMGRTLWDASTRLTGVDWPTD